MKGDKVEVKPQEIENTIAEAKQLADAVGIMYKMIIPDFDERERVKPPSANTETVKRTIEAFARKFPETRDQIMTMWINIGPAVDDELPDSIWLDRGP